jgi:hypothetical protein
VPSDEDPELEYIVFQLIGGTLDRLREDAIAMGESHDHEVHRQLKTKTWQEVFDRVERLKASA